MQDNDFITMRGPSSLAEVVGIVKPAAPAPLPGAEVAYVTLEEDVDAQIQYAAVDDEASEEYLPDGDNQTWPYMVTIESRIDGKSAAVRAQSRRIVAALRDTGWQFQLTSDLDDAVLAESA